MARIKYELVPRVIAYYDAGTVVRSLNRREPVIQLERVSEATATKHADGARVIIDDCEQCFRGTAVYVLAPHAMTPEERAVIAAARVLTRHNVLYFSYGQSPYARGTAERAACDSEVTEFRALKAAIETMDKPKPRFVQYETGFRDTQSSQFYSAGSESYRLVNLLNDLHDKATK